MAPAPPGRIAALLTMGVAILALVVQVPAAGAGAAPSPTAAQTDLFVTAFDDGLSFWFEVDGVAGRNPDIRVAPGAEVRIHFRNNGTVPHDFWVTALGGIRCCVAPNGTAEATVHMPMQDTAVSYLCHPHEATGMKGRFVVGSGPDTKTPWPLVGGLLALLVVAGVRKRFVGPSSRAKR